jgi:hypothetical protein
VIKTNVTTEKVLDFFTGSGGITANSAAVEKLMVSIIENLLARGNKPGDLADGSLIAFTLLNEHYIAIPAVYARDYFAGYVQTIRNRKR